MTLSPAHNWTERDYYFECLKQYMLDATFRHVSVLQCFLKCGVAAVDIDSWVENLRRVRGDLTCDEV